MGMIFISLCKEYDMATGSFVQQTIIVKFPNSCTTVFRLLPELYNVILQELTEKLKRNSPGSKLANINADITDNYYKRFVHDCYEKQP